MKKVRGGSEGDFRGRAERRLTRGPAESGELSAQAAREMIHELRVHQVELARDGVEAIELFRRARDGGAPFDVVILDLTIPGGMGGKEAVQKLREIDPHEKAIVSSGYSTDSVVADFRRFGFDGVSPSLTR